MVPTLSENLHKYLEPHVVYSLSQFPEKDVEIGYLQSYDKNEKEHISNNNCLEVVNVTDGLICTTDRLGFSRIHQSKDPERHPKLYIDKDYRYVELKLTISCYADGYQENAFCNKLACELGKDNKLVIAMMKARQEIENDSFSPNGRYIVIKARIRQEFLRKINRPVYIKEFDIVISASGNFSYQYHPEQPGTHVFKTDYTNKSIGDSGFSKSYLYVDNNKGRFRELWVVNGIEVINLKPVVDPELNSGVYIKRNQLSPDGMFEESSQFMTYLEFTEQYFVFTDKRSAENKRTDIEKALLMDKESIENKIQMGIKHRLEYQKTKDAIAEKKESKLLENITTAIKYLSIVAAAFIATRN